MSDLISRQMAIDSIEKAKTARTEDGEIYVAKVNAKRRTGEWIKGRNFNKEQIKMIAIVNDGCFDGGLPYCSNCCCQAPVINKVVSETDVCPNCGADMRGNKG